MRNMTTIYVDMDGVVSDFDYFIKDYMVEEKQHRVRFKSAVLNEKVFTRLEKQEGGDLLVDALRDIETRDPMVKIYFLTSVGTKDGKLGEEVAKQKITWLLKHGYKWKPLFVTEKKEKANYATKHSILIDDRPGSVEPFREAGGRAILHRDSKETVFALQEHLDILKWMR